MKPLFKIVLLLLAINVCGQPNENLLKYNFGILWTKTKNTLVYGFIGENYQRIRVKIISVTKDTSHSDTYFVTGKTMVKNNICDFKGTIKIKDVSSYSEMHLGVDDEYKDSAMQKQGVLTAGYYFVEDSSQSHTGIFEGNLVSYWYIDKNGKLRYDDIETYSDNYRNNQFIGTWTDYKSHQKKVCNWGDYRAPQSGNLDIGAGEFSPANEYLQCGWQTVRDAYFVLKPDSFARQEEERQWWKK